MTSRGRCAREVGRDWLKKYILLLPPSSSLTFIEHWVCPKASAKCIILLSHLNYTILLQKNKLRLRKGKWLPQMSKWQSQDENPDVSDSGTWVLHHDVLLPRDLCILGSPVTNTSYSQSSPWPTFIEWMNEWECGELKEQPRQVNKQKQDCSRPAWKEASVFFAPLRNVSKYFTGLP